MNEVNQGAAFSPEGPWKYTSPNVKSGLVSARQIRLQKSSMSGILIGLVVSAELNVAPSTDFIPKKSSTRMLMP
jgi:hypothetical protein